MANRRKTQNIQLSVKILQGIIVLGAIITLGRIFQLQILDHQEYAPLSRQNSIKMDVVNPARGLIFDRNGKILVDNQPIYSITITPSKFEMENLAALSDILGLEQELVLERITEAQNYSWHQTSRLFTEVPFETFSAVEENLWRLPGIGHQVESKRNYPLDLSASHLLGYLREASPNDYVENEELRLGDKIGKSGIEMVYDEYLRGQKGTSYLRVNAYGQTLGSFDEGNLNVSPQKGSNLVTTIDAELQELGEKLMQGKTGGIVALNPNNGEILSLVSAPNYDLGRLSGRMDSNYWLSVNVDSLKPLYNRAISSRQPPGSTFKPFMGLYGLHTGLITPNMEIRSTGSYIRGRAYRDLADPGMYDLKKALAKSSNYYFFWMMDRIGSNGGLDDWADKIRDFGMGPQNNIDLPFETRGIIPDTEYMNLNFGERNWGIGDLMSLGVGQGMVSVSPLQMAVAVSVIANGGYRVQPHLVREIHQNDNSVSYTNPYKEQIEWLRTDYIDAVKGGMREVVTDGSSRWFTDIKDIPTAGKTGTSQNPHGEDHGWFIAFAPYDDPQIAIAVLTENSGYGSISAAPVASLMIEQYLGGDLKRQYVLDHVLNYEPPSDDEIQDQDQLIEEEIVPVIEEEAIQTEAVETND
ncbi:MAG: penicillin-binding protein 2 [Balneolaceae bacterium]